MNEIFTRPAEGAVVANVSDSTDLTRGTCRSLWIGAGGSLKVTMRNGDEVAFAGVPAGLLALSVKRVWSTGTSCTGVVALY